MYKVIAIHICKSQVLLGDILFPQHHNSYGTDSFI